ncbi:MAG: biopolymer transporter ExbD [Desmonostoc vinosum HA7617-LM4]|jgi:biopolymer transport protein ExbD|nr:biopolymer transporter ExbD [Desmonostoc vinosum HA7617-LM4]
MKVNLHSPIEEAQIQIIPLIDVVFCILTFFLLAALQFTRQQAINVDLPKASANTTSNINSQGGTQIVTIDAVGNTFIEKQPIKREELAQRLKQYLQDNPSGVVVLNASRTATYNDVIETLDLLRQVGGDRVSLGIIPGPSQPSTNLSPIPGTTPIPSINPEGNLTPKFPSTPQVPLPKVTGQDINPASPGVSPILPKSSVSPAPVVPEKTSPTPKR